MAIELDALIPGSAWFRWRDALWLPTWKVCVFPTPEVEKNIIHAANYVMDPIRNLFGKPVLIQSWYRPELYNEWGTVGFTKYGVAGAKNSQHVLGKAIDFKIVTIPNEEIRTRLAPRLEAMNIRMEMDDGRDRVHVDEKRLLPGESRLFKGG